MLNEQSLIDEAQFVDAISKRLRQSHFMVLIIGDGIREGAESLSSYLQLHAGLNVGLALVDLSIWRDTEGRLLIVPRVPLHTVLVERGIVTVNSMSEVTVQPPKDKGTLAASAPPKAFTISEQEYFDQFKQRQPGLVIELRQFLSDIIDLGADSDEAGHAFRKEAGHLFRSEAGRDSDLMSATQGLLPRIEGMMFRLGGLVKGGEVLGLRRPGEGLWCRDAPLGWRWAKRA